ncbi:MAG: hypothetical protein AAFV09_16370 [Pseudomonadota bacterium]
MRDTPGIGHNKGPKPGAGWRRHCWRKARAELLGPTMPIEIVRRRVRRARQLGLSYPEYASILLGTGRDVTAFLFTVEGLYLRLTRELEMPGRVREAVQRIDRCALTGFSPSGEVPEAFRVELSTAAGCPIASVAPEPEPPVGWAEARRAIRATLDPLRLPGNSVVMIGSREVEADWARAANMARFLPRERYFAQNAEVAANG